MLSGLSVGRRVFFAFVLSGTLAGLAGVLFAARYATIASNAGTGLELQAVAAAVIGGVAIFGGSGTVAGAALGAILLSTIDRALPILGIPDFWQQAVVGVLIIGAIVLDRVLALRTAQTPALHRRRGDRQTLAARAGGRVMTVDQVRTVPAAPTTQARIRKLLLGRDAAIIALLPRRRDRRVVHGRQLLDVDHLVLPVPRRVPDPAHRAADDPDHHRGADRPVRGQHARPEQRARRGAVRAGLVARCRRAGRRCWSGALGGALNGFLVTVVGLPSLAVTIGTLALFRGLAVGILGTRAVTGFPSDAQDLVSARVRGDAGSRS